MIYLISESRCAKEKHLCASSSGVYHKSITINRALWIHSGNYHFPTYQALEKRYSCSHWVTLVQCLKKPLVLSYVLHAEKSEGSV